jgi:tetratricopeptide (TPR) repeat protein
MTAAPAGPHSAAPLRRPRRDVRLRVAFLALIAVVALGYALMHFNAGPSTGRGPDPAADGRASPHPPGFSDLRAAPASRGEVSELDYRDPAKAEAGAGDRQARAVLRAAAQSIRTRQYDQAIAMLNRQQALVQPYAQAYLLIARALEGKRDYQTARDFYNAAADRDPYLADAYWGFATSSEQLNDLEGAIGGMRSFLHVEGGDGPYRLRVARARAAIWEWEAKLGRGPWGPSKGIPPGFTEAEIRRDNRGVGLKMQVTGTENEAGERRAEMKHQDRFKLYDR